MSIDTKNSTYKTNLKEEASLWDKTAKDELKEHSPDYVYYRKTLPYKIYRNSYVEEMLKHIHHGDKVLELGCYNGWFTLEMARKGADADAHDISEEAIRIGGKYYRETKGKEKYTGNISYHITDLNFPKFPKNKYDVVVIRNVLHHIINLRQLFEELNNSLKPCGLILVDDGLPAGKIEALAAGAFLMLLPTDIPYFEKIRRVFRKGQILKRTQDMMDAKGASPFESVSGEESVDYLKDFFKVGNYTTYAAFIGVLTAKVRFPPMINILLLRMLNFIDVIMIKLGILRGTVYFLAGERT